MFIFQGPTGPSGPPGFPGGAGAKVGQNRLAVKQMLNRLGVV